METAPGWILAPENISLARCPEPHIDGITDIPIGREARLMFTRFRRAPIETAVEYLQGHRKSLDSYRNVAETMSFTLPSKGFGSLSLGERDA